jgi:hypothetical protein
MLLFLLVLLLLLLLGWLLLHLHYLLGHDWQKPGAKHLFLAQAILFSFSRSCLPALARRFLPLACTL